MTKQLTKRERDILQFIYNFMEDNNRSPSVWEIVKHFNFAYSHLVRHLKTIEEKGWIKRIFNNPHPTKIVLMVYDG